MITTVNKNSVISAGKMLEAMKAANKYNHDFSNEDLLLELVAIYVTEPADLMKLKNNPEFLENQKSLVYAELDNETFQDILSFFPLAIVKQYLKSLGLSQEQIQEQLNKAETQVEQLKNSISQSFQESSKTTQDQ